MTTTFIRRFVVMVVMAAFILPLSGCSSIKDCDRVAGRRTIIKHGADAPGGFHVYEEITVDDTNVPPAPQPNAPPPSANSCVPPAEMMAAATADSDADPDVPPLVEGDMTPGWFVKPHGVTVTRVQSSPAFESFSHWYEVNGQQFPLVIEDHDPIEFADGDLAPLSASLTIKTVRQGINSGTVYESVTGRALDILGYVYTGLGSRRFHINGIGTFDIDNEGTLTGEARIMYTYPGGGTTVEHFFDAVIYHVDRWMVPVRYLVPSVNAIS